MPLPFGTIVGPLNPVTQFAHNTGQSVADPTSTFGEVWAGLTGVSTSGDLLTWGPYTRQVTLGLPYVLRFRLKVSANTPTGVCVTLTANDTWAPPNGYTAPWVEVSPSAFTAPMQWQDFYVPFAVPVGASASGGVPNVEFWSKFNDIGVDVYIDSIACMIDPRASVRARGGGNPGTIYGSPTMGQPGPLAAPGSKSFYVPAGNSNWIDIPTVYPMGHQASWEMFTKWDWLGFQPGGSVNPLQSTCGGLAFQPVTGGQPEVVNFVYRDGTDYQPSYVLNPAPSSDWHLILFVYDDPWLYFYIDGILVFSAQVNGGAITPIPGAPPGTRICRAMTGTWMVPDMYAAECAVYQGAVSATRALAHFNASKSLDPSAYPASVLADNPIGYWRLQETSGSVAYDSSVRVPPRLLVPAR